MPRVYTTPRTWADGTLMTAMILNTEFRDNLLWFKNPPSASVVIPTATTSADAWVEMLGSSVSLTTTGGNIFMFYCGFSKNSNSVFISWYDLAIDGVRQDNTANGMTSIVTPVANQNDPIAMFWESSTAPTAGAHNYSVYWKGNGLSGAGYLFVMEER